VLHVNVYFYIPVRSVAIVKRIFLRIAIFTVVIKCDIMQSYYVLTKTKQCCETGHRWTTV